MRWLELSVEAHVEAVEAVGEILARLGRGIAVSPTRLVTDRGDGLSARADPTAPYVVTAHVPDDDGASAAVDRTQRALWHLQAFGLGPVGELRLRRVADTDWAEAWKAGYAPQRVGRLVIVPSWRDEPIGPDEVEVRLDPGMAFGTGLHPSTRGCLLLLHGVTPPPSEMFDVGSGSGILAIAGLRLGIQRADCIDTDPIGVAATRENADRNGLGERLTVSLGTIAERPRRCYPLVCANLVAGLLVEYAPSIAACLLPGGVLIAGGVVRERADEVEAALAENGVRAEHSLEEGDWVTMRLRVGP